MHLKHPLRVYNTWDLEDMSASLTSVYTDTLTSAVFLNIVSHVVSLRFGTKVRMESGTAQPAGR